MLRSSEKYITEHYKSTLEIAENITLYKKANYQYIKKRYKSTLDRAENTNVYKNQSIRLF